MADLIDLGAAAGVDVHDRSHKNAEEDEEGDDGVNRYPINGLHIVFDVL